MDNAVKNVVWSEADWKHWWDIYYSLMNPDDKGKKGKTAEMVLRQWFRRNSPVASTIQAISPQGKTDVSVTRTVNGVEKRYRLEIKSASGELDNYKRSQYVAYLPEIIPGSDLSKAFALFTVDEFTAMLTDYPGGETTKFNKESGRTNIQSFWTPTQPGASRPMRSWFDTACIEKPTVEEWEAKISGREFIPPENNMREIQREYMEKLAEKFSVNVVGRVDDNGYVYLTVFQPRGAKKIAALWEWFERNAVTIEKSDSGVKYLLRDCVVVEIPIPTKKESTPRKATKKRKVESADYKVLPF